MNSSEALAKGSTAKGSTTKGVCSTQACKQAQDRASAAAAAKVTAEKKVVTDAVSAASAKQDQAVAYADSRFNSIVDAAQKNYDDEIKKFNDNKSARTQEIERSIYDPHQKAALGSYNMLLQACGGSSLCRADAKKGYDANLKSASDTATKQAAVQIQDEYRRTVQNAKSAQAYGLNAAASDYVATLRDANTKFNKEAGAALNPKYPGVGSNLIANANSNFDNKLANGNSYIASAAKESASAVADATQQQSEANISAQQEADANYAAMMSQVETHYIGHRGAH